MNEDDKAPRPTSVRVTLEIRAGSIEAGRLATVGWGAKPILDQKVGEHGTAGREAEPLGRLTSCLFGTNLPFNRQLGTFCLLNDKPPS